MSAQAITGGPPPGDGFLRRIERAMKDGRLPDPQSGRGAAAYGLFGIAIGFFGALAGWF